MLSSEELRGYATPARIFHCHWNNFCCLCRNCANLLHATHSYTIKAPQQANNH
ncbi:hypothetical protein PCASD_07602 [Puccinia coronata f. sp. avenae]|uniref:Uncharacterized protein n=1 Tax=Puccinia coronata f. sp. avenae TaxID=200324 RepID=A0A2N5UN02_9BASI|nr:hypothetical protein PCASD_07602 [Puccinia coronata f. sp. avenae]